MVGKQEEVVIMVTRSGGKAGGVVIMVTRSGGQAGGGGNLGH